MKRKAIGLVAAIALGILAVACAFNGVAMPGGAPR